MQPLNVHLIQEIDNYRSQRDDLIEETFGNCKDVSLECSAYRRMTDNMDFLFADEIDRVSSEYPSWFRQNGQLDKSPSLQQAKLLIGAAGGELITVCHQLGQRYHVTEQPSVMAQKAMHNQMEAICSSLVVAGYEGDFSEGQLSQIVATFIMRANSLDENLMACGLGVEEVGFSAMAIHMLWLGFIDMD